jgi:hypothetical protein
LKLHRFALAAAFLVSASPALAMDVATFLARADKLQKKGPLALFTSEYRLLKREAEGAGAQLKAENAALVKAGKRTPYCPPKKGSLSSSELLSGFRAIPAADRPRTSVKDGMRIYLAKKWPCRR